ncbi:hypothetical protein ACH5RR_028419 [Cinchona calisaya]|uniref:Late blight resistance protein R1A-like N-terminal domain-containing protein n=1 Tax=Cinchona calisaya TaxID=153742 RepID=A0ABD2YPZ8_9GENT
MVSNNPVDSILLHLKLVLNNLRQCHFDVSLFDELEFKRNSLFLKIFLLCARNWSNNHHMLLESNDDHKKLDLSSFLSSIEDSVNKIGRAMESLCRRSETSLQSMISSSVDSSRRDVYASLQRVASKLWQNKKYFKQEIIKVHITLSDHNISLQSSCCLIRGDELVDIIDSILQNLQLCILKDGRFFGHMVKRYNVLLAQIEALEDKLTFLKSFIGFAKLFCVEGCELEHLLTHIQVVVLIAARLSYIFLFCKDDKEVYDPKMLGELLQKINHVVLQVYEACISVLTVSKSSASLQTMKMDKLILRDFNDSLIGSLWQLLLCNTIFMVSVKGQMKILYEGLRFFRSILRKPQKQMDELDGRFVTVLIGAAIVICSLYVVNNVNEVDVNDSVVRDSPDCCAMLVNINNDIKLIEAQITGSSMM